MPYSGIKKEKRQEKDMKKKILFLTVLFLIAAGSWTAVPKIKTAYQRAHVQPDMEFSAA